MLMPGTRSWFHAEIAEKAIRPARNRNWLMGNQYRALFRKAEQGLGKPPFLTLRRI
jgi:hypothetical protein